MTVFITGATDGLGRAFAARLAQDGHPLILHGRDAGKLADTAAELDTEVHTVLADLSELAQVRKLATDVRGLTDHLDVFVSNAGIGSGLPEGRSRQTSADGYELRFAVNYLAGFLLTLELLPLLRASTPARIVNVSSLGQQALDFDDLMIERDYSGTRAYCQSKLAQIMSGFELASRVSDVTVNSLHPATYMPTKMVLQEVGHSIDTLETGVNATYRLAVGADVEGVTGRFFDRTSDSRADGQAYDPAARRELWRRSLELVDHPDIG
jgi:NAD(P)-dependent dehydrogenase (short-subunit alcohol dehydrogenase family)